MPPVFWACAITCNAMVVFPEDSGPKISTTRPRGKPPTPSAASNEIAPVGITEIGTMASFDPSRMMEPLPNCFSICANARSIALVRSSAIEHCSFFMKTFGVDGGLYYTANKKRIARTNSGNLPKRNSYVSCSYSLPMERRRAPCFYSAHPHPASHHFVLGQSTGLDYNADPPGQSCSQSTQPCVLGHGFTIRITRRVWKI